MVEEDLLDTGAIEFLSTESDRGVKTTHHVRLKRLILLLDFLHHLTDHCAVVFLDDGDDFIRGDLAEFLRDGGAEGDVVGLDDVEKGRKSGVVVLSVVEDLVGLFRGVTVGASDLESETFKLLTSG